MPVNPSRASRNAETATSLAAFSTIESPSAPAQRTEGQREAGKPVRVRRLEVEPPGPREVERRQRRRPPLGIRERVLNG